jgi:hypothetical protein
MNESDSVFQKAVGKLLIEIFNGPAGDEAYVLNPGDSGLLRQLESISAAVASAIPPGGKSSIAAHTDHVQYGLSLLTRWIGGEENPWATADWNASWRRTAVSEDQWRALLGNLRKDAEVWRNAVSRMTGWDDLSAAGTISSVAHTAYHLGAIRQILAAVAAR